MDLIRARKHEKQNSGILQKALFPVIFESGKIEAMMEFPEGIHHHKFLWVG